MERSSHSNQEQQEELDSESEVKKIYLLQPMSKLQPQNQHQNQNQQQQHQQQHQQHQQSTSNKGNYLRQNEQQNQIQPPPTSKTHQQQAEQTDGRRPNQQESYDAVSQLYENPNAIGTSSKGHPEFKVLPIVVIPPIAPMAPIQLQHSQTNSHQFSTNSEAKPSRSEHKSYESVGNNNSRNRMTYNQPRERPPSFAQRPRGGDRRQVRMSNHYGQAMRARPRMRPDSGYHRRESRASSRWAAYKAPQVASPMRRWSYQDPSRYHEHQAGEYLGNQHVAFDDEPGMDMTSKANIEDDRWFADTLAARAPYSSGGFHPDRRSRRMEDPEARESLLDLSSEFSAEPQDGGYHNRRPMGSLRRMQHEADHHEQDAYDRELAETDDWQSSESVKSVAHKGLDLDLNTTLLSNHSVASAQVKASSQLAELHRLD